MPPSQTPPLAPPPPDGRTTVIPPPAPPAPPGLEGSFKEPGDPQAVSEMPSPRSKMRWNQSLDGVIAVILYCPLQVTIPPHPSGAVPETSKHVRGRQQVPLVRHTSPVAHPGQVRVCPQPSSTLPHVRSKLAQVLGVHAAHTFELQISLVLQVPQSSFLPQPSSSEPQFLAAEAKNCGSLDDG